jgi:hypothetical protein
MLSCNSNRNKAQCDCPCWDTILLSELIQKREKEALSVGEAERTLYYIQPELKFDTATKYYHLVFKSGNYVTHEYKNVLGYLNGITMFLFQTSLYEFNIKSYIAGARLTYGYFHFDGVRKTYICDSIVDDDYNRYGDRRTIKTIINKSIDSLELHQYDFSKDTTVRLIIAKEFPLSKRGGKWKNNPYNEWN